MICPGESQIKKDFASLHESKSFFLFLIQFGESKFADQNESTRSELWSLDNTDLATGNISKWQVAQVASGILSAPLIVGPLFDLLKS